MNDLLFLSTKTFVFFFRLLSLWPALYLSFYQAHCLFPSDRILPLNSLFRGVLQYFCPVFFCFFECLRIRYFFSAFPVNLCFRLAVILNPHSCKVFWYIPFHQKNRNRYCIQLKTKLTPLKKTKSVCCLKFNYLF